LEQASEERSGLGKGVSYRGRVVVFHRALVSGTLCGFVAFDASLDLS
jgi:hypothetical protein